MEKNIFNLRKQNYSLLKIRYSLTPKMKQPNIKSYQSYTGYPINFNIGIDKFNNNIYVHTLIIFNQRYTDKKFFGSEFQIVCKIYFCRKSVKMPATFSKEDKIENVLIMVTYNSLREDAEIFNIRHTEKNFYHEIIKKISKTSGDVCKISNAK